MVTSALSTLMVVKCLVGICPTILLLIFISFSLEVREKNIYIFNGRLEERTVSDFTHIYTQTNQFSFLFHYNVDN